MLISMASGPDGTGPGGLAEFTNEGEFVASHKAPNHPYETVVKAEFNRYLIDGRGVIREIYALAFFSERQAWVDIQALLREAARP
jgi:hypothetical protein